MKIFRTFDELHDDVFLAIGVFDGVHLGHQRVIGQARYDAHANGGKSVVMTFEPHPMRVLQPDKAPLLLTSTAHKLRLVEALDVDACLLITFDKRFSEMPAEKFVEKISRCRQVCVGTRFRFGHDRRGDVRLLEKLALQFGFNVKEIKSVLTADGEMISSTSVRQHVLDGKLDRAAAMLGRPFSILGTVEQGDHRGHKLGFPTANLDAHNEVLPPDGVYAVRVRLLKEMLGGVVNIGVRPTFDERERVLEVHIFDFHRDIYGTDIEVVFLEKLRGEKKFDSVDALKSQIATDVQAARAIVSKSS